MGTDQGDPRPSLSAVAARTPLVGREREAERLRQFVSGSTSDGPVLLLSGEAGVGKTALLDWAADLAEATGVRVLRATGSQFEADVTFGALHQLLRPCFGEIVALSPLHAEALSVALCLGEGAPPGQLLVAGAVLNLLDRVAVDARVLLVIDDLPWVDRASGVVLGMIARRLAGHRVALLAASRSEEPSFFEYGTLPVEEVKPLPEEAAALLLSQRYPAMTPRVRTRLLADARGNPLALLELPVALADRPPGPVPAVLPLNRRLQAVFADRIRALPAATYDVLLLAALDGTGDLRLIRRFVADSNGDPLGPAERGGLVRVQETSLVFRHPLIRSAVVEMSTSEQRRQAHRTLAEHLTDQPERRVWHLAEATTEPDEYVAALLQEVAHTNLRRGDSVGAVTELLRAAELSPTGAGRSGRLAEAAYLGSIVTGDLRDAPRLLDAARRAHPDPNGPLSTAVAGAYYLLHGDGDIDTAHHLLVAAVNDLADPADAHDKVLVEALYTLLMICFFGGRADLWPPFETAVDRLRPRPPELLAVLAKTFSDPARVSPAVLERLDASVAGLSHQVSPARIIRTGIAAAYLDRLGDCREALRRAVQHGREGGAVTSAIEALFLLGQDAYHTGEWDQAQSYVDEGLRLCETHGYQLLGWPGRYIAALLAGARGDIETPATIADQMDAWAAPRRARALQLYAAHVRSLTALGQGDFEAAYRHASTISRAGTLASHVPHALWVFLDLVEAALHTGRTAEAAAHVAAAREIGLDRLSARLRLVVLATSAMTGPDTDDELVEEAISSPGNDRWPFDLARIQLAYGSHLRRIKDPRARRHLDAAADTFRRLGAQPWTTRADNERRAAGVTVETPSTLGPASLTAQQRQIANLAAAGLTNKQIAERLFLSPRTVSTHLYQLFPKLGITTRAALRDALDTPPSPD